MAQRDHEQIKSNRMPGRLRRDEETAVFSFLLQQHLVFLLREAATRISGRVMCLASAGFLILVSHPSTFELIASWSIAMLVASLWAFEQKSLARRINALEETLVEQSSSTLEDIYIKSRYFAFDRITARFIGSEPMLWTLTLGLLAALRRSGLW